MRRAIQLGILLCLTSTFAHSSAVSIYNNALINLIEESETDADLLEEIQKLNLENIHNGIYYCNMDETQLVLELQSSEKGKENLERTADPQHIADPRT